MASHSVFALAAAHARLDAAVRSLGRLRDHRSITIIGSTRGAADDFARRLAASSQATFGIARFSLLQFAARTALLTLARRGATPSPWLVTEAIATRTVFEVARSAPFTYFEPVQSTPGFPRALARTLGELRGADVRVDDLRAQPLVGVDLARLLDQFERSVADGHASDRADLLRAAARHLVRTRAEGTFVLLDVPMTDSAERELLESIVDATERVVATIPPGDGIERLFKERGVVVEYDGTGEQTDIALLSRHLFDTDHEPPRRRLDGSLEVFSAPSEGRECVEIARRVLARARDGVRFDEMAVLVRSPQSYFGLLEHAMTRAGVPVWFDRGLRRPHPAGRAFLALLTCASERLSAARFAEYLSLAQVPRAGESVDSWEVPSSETTWQPREREDDELETEELVAATRVREDESSAVVGGTLRAPWRWESLIIDARIVRGSADRWRRRFDGHRHELKRRIVEAGKAEGTTGAESAAGGRLEATLEQLGHLEQFALPIVEEMEQWTPLVTWGVWLDRFATIAPRVLRHPAHVQRVFEDLRTLAAIGPVSLDEARRVLASRLLTVEAESPSRRYGRLFVGTPHQARGRTFRVVFVPGLAERLFPQKPREDPLLLDAVRHALDEALPTESRRGRDERQLLKLAVGAASERVCVSYPRLDVNEARARVPSFYALDLLRAATGEVPAHETLERQAVDAGGALLSWPAPADPSVAIDEVEHDLAVVRRLFDHPTPEAIKGHAHYLLNLSEPLRRSVIERWRRGRPEWSASDGLTRVTPQIAEALGERRLSARPYSPSALQRFASCPYQFVLASIFRLHPLEEPTPLDRIDALTRGSLVHEVQARLMRDLKSRDVLPLRPGNLEMAGERLREVIVDVMTRAHEMLSPAVERVWADDVASMSRDLHGWLERMALEPDWVPTYFELAFGPVPGERDPASSSEPQMVDKRFVLRGAIDVIDVHGQTGRLRVTDHKTGRPPEGVQVLRIGGGKVLQPILYGLAAERMFGTQVDCGRLYFCTIAGGFESHTIPLDEHARRAGVEVLEVIDRAIAEGHLVAAPEDGACERCDFRSVCGREVSRRIIHKKGALLEDLAELRRRP